MEIKLESALSLSGTVAALALLMFAMSRSVGHFLVHGCLGDTLKCAAQSFLKCEYAFFFGGVCKLECGVAAARSCALQACFHFGGAVMCVGLNVLVLVCFSRIRELRLARRPSKLAELAFFWLSICLASVTYFDPPKNESGIENSFIFMVWGSAIDISLNLATKLDLLTATTVISHGYILEKSKEDPGKLVNIFYMLALHMVLRALGWYLRPEPTPHAPGGALPEPTPPPPGGSTSFNYGQC